MKSSPARELLSLSPVGAVTAALALILVLGGCDRVESDGEPPNAGETEGAEKPGADSTRKLNPSELESLLASEDLFFLDVRSADEIRELGTLPGYTNIPIDELATRMDELPRGKPIVTA